MFSIRKAGVVALAAITVAVATLAMTTSADARKRHRGHHHHHHHRGVGVGVATGLAIGAIGAGVVYGAHCWQNQVVGYTRSGRPIVRRVNVC